MKIHENVIVDGMTRIVAQKKKKIFKVIQKCRTMLKQAFRSLSLSYTLRSVMGIGHQWYMWSPFFDICMAAGHVL